MVVRGQRKARNKWVKNVSPLSKEDPGKRLPERCTARIQVIPENAFNQYGDRKIAGVTLSELKNLLETQEPIVIRDRDRILLRVVLGKGDNEWTPSEIKQIIEEIERDGILSISAPMAVDERKNEALRRLMETPQEASKNELVAAASSLTGKAKSTLAKLNKAELQDVIDTATSDVEPAAVG